MNFIPSKVKNCVILKPRCEICFSDIEQNQTVTLIVEKVGATIAHFVHTECYDKTDAELIPEKMKEMAIKTQADQELFSLMEECNEDGK